mgnify:FL=1
MRHCKRGVVALLMVGLISIVVPVGDAVAVGWGPLRSVYNGIERVRGSGYFYNSGNSSAVTQYNLTDSRNDGNTVYGYTTGSLFQSNYDGTTSWINQGSYSTPEIKNTTSTMYTSFPLSSSGSRARGAVMVCAQMGFPVPDSCSGNSYPTFDY